MANFEIAHKIVAKHEGGYSNLEWDRGNYICDYNGKGYSAKGASKKGKTAKDFTCDAGTLKFVGTNWGISAPILATYLGRTPTVADMKNLSNETATKIFKKNYWDRINGDQIKDQDTANILYDSIVQHGEGGTKNIINDTLQKLNYGAITVLSKTDTTLLINKIDPRLFFETYKQKRIESYQKAGQDWGIDRTKKFIYGIAEIVGEKLKENKGKVAIFLAFTSLFF